MAQVWRRRWYAAPGRQRRLRRPVISIGNLSFGGRGKTPLAAHLARMLLEAGERPAVLTRGYARRQPEDGVVVVSDGAHLLADVGRSGDEPLMIARAVPGACVLVCDERVMAGALAERALGATVHILDDGFQHLQLARDVDLVIVSPEDLEGRAMPFGQLREPVEALAAADAVIMDGDFPARGAGRSALASQRWALERRLGTPEPLEPGRSWTAGDRRVVALAGIAQPERFIEGLKRTGWVVADALTFGDHHAYTPADMARIGAAAARAGAPVLTTAKDAVRLLPLRPFPAPIASIPLSVGVEPASEFRDWLLRRVRQKVPA